MDSLLQTGKIDIDMKDKKGWTALFRETRSSAEILADLLLQMGKFN